ncbi:hypothetical protein Q4489_08805 [Thalassotalea sp. 1_MG-2023]|uniref:hypothetical protein n=1 Tax=Thalassotalea sp. 1_MG-2023 TaxID=3062680 RepID=UPI0026E209A7|nr:hypothetical protein [Thalassotalea sp. 1_MG-2023]MDO6427109.1 hypothetical protein [Thalassotalea sp. 1_MG-2023]
MNNTRIVVTLTLLMGSSGLHAKTNCSSYETKLNTIQSKQRQGYSASQGVKLAKQERAAYNKWWDCKRGKLKKATKKAKGDKKLLKRELKPKALIKLTTVKPLTNNIRIKAKYHGAKQQAWLDFYQPLAICKSPKKLSTFAKCLKDEERQQLLFEQQ